MNLHTKKELSELLCSLIAPLKKYYSEHNALLKLKSSGTWYEKRAADTEAFARILWGLAPFWAGGETEDNFEKIYLRGIANGTNTDCEEYWGECHDRDQKFVEMSAIGYALLIAQDKLWEPLGKTQRIALVNWLGIINDREVVDSNWLFFRVIVNIALRKLGQRYNADILRQDLSRIDDFYIGGGWYEDGKGGQKDYYNAFAFHFLGLLYAYCTDDEYSVKFKERASEFAKDYIYWFSDDGEGLPYGRSLTYRFAQTAFWSMCVLNDVLPFSVGQMKGFINRTLRKWLRSDMLDNSGILTVGYKYPNILMAEHYNAVGSAYWCLMIFAVLALDDKHEYWQAAEEKMPALAECRTIEKADMLVRRYCGEVTAYPSGTADNFGCGQIIPKYLKFAYSTEYGFNVPKSNISVDEAAADNMLCFVYDGLVFVRKSTSECKMYDDRIVISWSPFVGIDVVTTVKPTEYGHIRTHNIKSEYDCTAYDCGFAVACGDDDACARSVSENSASAVSARGKCVVKGGNGGCGHIINASPNTNLYYPRTVIPSVKYEIAKGESNIETRIYQI